MEKSNQTKTTAKSGHRKGLHNETKTAVIQMTIRNHILKESIIEQLQTKMKNSIAKAKENSSSVLY